MILNNSKLLVRIYDKDQKGIKQIDLSNNIVDWSIENDFRPKISLNNSYIGLIGRDTNVLFCINSQNGEVTWSYDTKYFNSWQDYDGTDKPSQVQKILGVYEDRLYISLTSGKILILDVITGKQLALLANDKNKDQGYFNGHFSKALELDEKSGMLIQLFNNRYTTLNLKTNEVTESIIQEMSDQKLYNIDNFVFDDEYIYLTEKYVTVRCRLQPAR